MPQLERTVYDSQTIRMYRSFRISRRGAISQQELIQGCIEKEVVDICASCVSRGYYILGLEWVELSEDISMLSTYDNSDSIMYPSYSYRDMILSLSLIVRRFSDKLTIDEIYDWTGKSSERVLFELRQLGEARKPGSR